MNTFPVVDIRQSQEGNRVLIGSLHLPAKDWSDRSLELPPRKHKFSILFSSKDEVSVVCAAMIKDRFGTDVAFSINTDDEIESELFWASFPSDLITVGGPPGSEIELSLSKKEQRLWQPSSFLHEFLDSFEIWTGSSQIDNRKCHILDAGCGTGRNAIFLAQSIVSSKIVAIDNRRSMIEKAEKFITRCKVKDQVQCTIADIDEYINSFSNSNNHLFDIVLFMRFVHKSALSKIHTLLQRDGIVVVEGFHVSSPHPTDDNQKIKEGEVSQILRNSGKEVTVLLEKITEIEDMRPVLVVVCRLQTKL